MQSGYPIMSEPSLLWIKKRDGHLQPFDADQISRDLFAATQRLGSTDAFLARTGPMARFIFSQARPKAARSPLPRSPNRRQGGARAGAFGPFPDLPPVADRRKTACGGGPQRQSEAALSWDQVNRLVESAPSASGLAWQRAEAVCVPAACVTCSARIWWHADQKLLTLGNLDAPLELSGLALNGADAAAETIAEARDLAGAVRGPR